MPTATIRSISALWVRSGGGSAAKNLSADKRMIIRATGGEGGFTYLTFSLPAPRGVVYKSAKLKMFNSSPMAGSNNVYLNKIIQGWSVAKTTWNTRPNFTSTGRVGLNKTNAPKNTLWEFDITSIMNSISNSSETWYGLALSSGASAVWQYFYHPQASSVYGPVLEVEWYEKPRRPQELNPSELRSVSEILPTFQSDFFDIVGSTTMGAIQVQISSTIDFSSPLWDSGMVDTSVPELDTADPELVPSPPVLVNGATYAWRVRVRDNADLWSEWSLPAAFNIQAKGSVTINSPGADPNNYIEEPTPPILWNVSGMTQRKWQVLIWNSDKTDLLHDSGENNGTDDSYTPSWKKQSPFELEENYVVEVRSWDSINRASTPGDPPYTSAEQVFEYRDAVDVSPIESLEVTAGSNHPWAVITATRGTAPDYFALWIDGKVFATNLDPSNHDIGGGQYQFIDKTSIPRRTHTWEVKAIVNGRSSANNPKVTKVVKPATAYLSSLNFGWAVPIFNYSPDIEALDGTSVVTVMNSDEALTVYEGGGARQGTFSGLISGAVGSATSLAHLNNLLSMKSPSRRGLPCVLTYADQRIICSISNISFEPTVFQEEVLYAVSFFLTERAA